MYDYPAFIDKILQISKAEQITLIGHSVSGGQFLILGSERPKYTAEKIKLAILLCPFFNPPKKSKSKIINTVVKFSNIILVWYRYFFIILLLFISLL